MEKSRVGLENGLTAELYRCEAVIVGSGAAGLNCAERLYDAGVTDIAVITTNLFGGTSYCSGSDKQTYYKMSVFGDVADSPLEMARALFDGGCMNGDLAYIESLYSLPAFYHLVDNGVPFPFNEFGAFVGYKTDHDPRQRATSAGPKTSRMMVETSLAQVRQRGIPIFHGTTVVRLATASADEKRICGLVAIQAEQGDAESLRIVLFQSPRVVLATGGPGELYATNVYPEGQVSLHGVALDAGAAAVNLGESQFGIASIGFRWNLSGSYQQVAPSYFSEASGGNRHDFLQSYYRNPLETASNIFLKGYQWPFSAERVNSYASSLIDIAVERERRAGKRVFIDFMTNPAGDFSVSRLHSEASDFLMRSRATQEIPYERLAFMNPDSIAVYTEKGVDLKEPLEIAVCFQHNNGGLAVDADYQTEVNGLFAIGELAGCHGVQRPGGAALNSGQVGAIRVAQYISSARESDVGACTAAIISVGVEVLRESHRMLNSEGLAHTRVRSQLQMRMTNAAGIIRSAQGIAGASVEAEQERRRIQDTPISASNLQSLTSAWETRNLVITHSAMLKSIDAYIADGGGSRGSYLVIDGDLGDAPGCPAHRVDCPEHKLKRVKVSGPGLDVAWESVKPLPVDDSWFETTWAACRVRRSDR